MPNGIERFISRRNSYLSLSVTASQEPDNSLIIKYSVSCPQFAETEIHSFNGSATANLLLDMDLI
jgi:hypothetical protein